MKKHLIYRKEVLVEGRHIDNLAHVNNQVYLSWVLEIAKLHWHQLASEEQIEQYYWVVRRHELDYFAPAFLGDRLQITTWIKDLTAAQSVRCVEILKGDQRLFVAQTTWVIFSTSTSKICRIPPSLKKLF